MLSLLRKGRFRWMWAGQTASTLGNRVQGIGLVWLVLTLTDSPLALSSVLIAQSVPSAALMLLGGAVSDRLAPRAAMLLSNVVQALLCAVLMALVVTHHAALWQLYPIAALMGACGAFFTPAFTAIVPELVDGEALAPANALVGTGEQVAELAGPTLGGIIVSALGTGGAFALNGLSFLAGAAGVLPCPVRGERGPQRGIWRSIAQGLRHARRSPELLLVLGVVSADALTYTGVFAVGLPLVARDGGHGAFGLGLLGLSWGLGQLAGAVSAGITGLPRRWGVLLIIMTVAGACAFAVLGLAHGLPAPMVVLVLLGFGAAYSSDIALPTWLQRTTPASLLGRVGSLIGLCQGALGPISMAAFGALAERGRSPAFLACAVVMLLTALLLALAGPGRRLQI